MKNLRENFRVWQSSLWMFLDIFVIIEFMIHLLSILPIRFVFFNYSFLKSSPSYYDCCSFFSRKHSLLIVAIFCNSFFKFHKFFILLILCCSYFASFSQLILIRNPRIPSSWRSTTRHCLLHRLQITIWYPWISYIETLILIIPIFPKTSLILPPVITKLIC